VIGISQLMDENSLLYYLLNITAKGYYSFMDEGLL
jgi:hypothetical protein